jgi:cytochrome c peroxidase
MKLFYGRAGCSACHRGKFQTDHEFHAIAMPQIGPGKGNGPSGLEDFGRENVTLQEGDRFRFRTPSLRNVALTGPWGHDGAFNSLRATIEHHRQPNLSLEGYDPRQAVLPSRSDLDGVDFRLLEDTSAMTAIAEACELQPSGLSDQNIGLLVEFLQALTDPDSVDLRMDVPQAVPSGLTLAE